MHLEAQKFLDYCYKNFTKFYIGKALDVGSGDINGTNKKYFNNASSYVGCDIYPAKNVDIVSKCHELSFQDDEFDIIISSECFEHDMYYEKSIAKIMKMLKQGGLFVFTCAGTGRPEHGTRRTSPYASLTTKINDAGWADYYKNLTETDVLNVLGFAQTFPYSRFYYNPKSNDLYFVGIKGFIGVSLCSTIPDYHADYKIGTQSYNNCRKTVVVYVYHQFNTNVDFFLKHGIFESDKVDFIIVCNDDKSKPLKLPTCSNVSQMTRQNIGHDFGGWSDALFKNGLKDKYDFFLLINSTVRGPFLPPWCQLTDWTELFTRLIDFETKLSGTTIGLVDGKAIIQSMVLCFDRIGLDIAIKDQIISPNPVQKTKERVVNEHEVQFSLSIHKYGYKVRPIMAAYYKTNLSGAIPTQTHVVDHCMTNGYFGVNLHPYEVIFIKDNRDINKNLDINAVTRHHNSGFDSSKTIGKIVPQFVVTQATPFSTGGVGIGGSCEPNKNSVGCGVGTVFATKRSTVVPIDFDWNVYLELNPDIRNSIQTKEKAVYHWTYYGSREARVYKKS